MAFRFSAILLILISYSCKQEIETEKVDILPVADGKSFNAAFLILDGVYNSELMAPYDIFQHTIFHTKGGIKVFTVSPSKKEIATFEGLKIVSDYIIGDTLPEIDILVVPSAEHNMDTDLENDLLIDFVKKIGGSAEYTISLCDGAFVLAKAGLVDGRQSTTFPTDIGKYRNMFPHLSVKEDLSFVHDNNLLTSAGGAKSYDVALYLVHHLYGDQVAKNVGKGLVIDWSLDDYQYLRIWK